MSDILWLLATPLIFFGTLVLGDSLRDPNEILRHRIERKKLEAELSALTSVGRGAKK